MPEVHFYVRWPSGQEERCYSPSTVILDHLEEGASYELGEFARRTRTALELASERVMAKYGYECSSALDQLRTIEERIRAMPAAERIQPVTVLAFDRHEPRDARRTSEVRRMDKPATWPVIVVGGGHAGLAMSYFLKQSGIAHAVLEGDRVAHSWRSKRWDTFCLVTPNWQCTLPGHPYDGPDGEGFMVKDQIVDYVERYAKKYELPVHEGVRVLSLSGDGDCFVLETTRGRLLAEQVVVATGAYHLPFIPPSAAGFPEQVTHLHSENYRNPQSLPEGAVLVVGTGQSGVQIAEDLHLAGRQVHLAVGSAPRCARRYRGRDVTAWLDDMGYYDIPYDQHPDRDQVRDKTNHYVTGRDGGHDIDLRAFALQGMKLYGTLLDSAAGVASFAADLEANLDDADDVYRRINRSIDQFIDKHGVDAPRGEVYEAPWRPPEPTLELDVSQAGITSVIWSIGFRSDFSWVKCEVMDERGHVRHDRGVTEVPGLYFLGLPWQYSWGSGRFFGVGRDAEHLLLAIQARRTLRAQDRPAQAQLSMRS
jgi:putative flavoprotein involved in K+ transport